MFRTIAISTTALAIAAGLTAPAVASTATTQAPTGVYTATLNAESTTHSAFGSNTLNGFFKLDGNNVVTMSAGCNTISAPITSWDGGTITLGQLTSTYIGCSGLHAHAEEALVRLMSSPFTYDMKENGVNLSFEGQTIVFNKEQMMGIPHGYRFLSPSESTVPALKNTTTKAYFIIHETGEVTGSTGCRPFRAALKDFKSKTLKDMEMDRRKCHGEAATVEEAFLTAVGINAPGVGIFDGKYVFSN